MGPNTSLGTEGTYILQDTAGAKGLSTADLVAEGIVLGVTLGRLLAMTPEDRIDVR